MKTLRFLSALAGLLFCGQTLFAAPLDNWHWRNPLPNGNPQAGPHTMTGVVFADGKFVATGAAGVVSISSDTTNWTESATATTNNLNGLAYLNGLFVAVGNGGTVETSVDGTNWILRPTGITNSLSAVAYANGKYVAVGATAVICSANLANWSPAISGLSGATGITGGSAGFMAVVGTADVFLSADGLVWTNETFYVPYTPFPGRSLHNCIVTYATGAYLVGGFVPHSGFADEFMFRSVDGLNWTTNDLGNVSASPIPGFSLNFFFDENGTVVAGGYSYAPFLQFSSDGITWTTTNPSTFFHQGTAGAYGNGTFVIVAPAEIPSSYMPQILTSTDGVIWTNRQHAPYPPAGPTADFTSIAFSNGIYVVGSSNSITRSTDGLVYSTVSNSPALSSTIAFASGFVCVGSGGKIYLSGDGLSWTQRNSGTVNNLHGVTAGSNLLVAVGDNGTIQTSPTGTIWTSRSSGTSLPLYGVAYANGLFVAVGQLGTVLTSPDGISWSGQDSGQLTDLLSVSYGAAGFAAVGPGGMIVISMNGVDWTQPNSGTTATLENITFGNGYYLAVGDNATALTSHDGITWTPHNLGATGGQNFYGAAFLNNRFQVVGTGGTILESDVIAPLFDVQVHRDGKWLTAFVTPGLNFRIQTCTNLAAPVWTDAATFNGAAAITQWTNPATGLKQQFYRAISP